MVQPGEIIRRLGAKVVVHQLNWGKDLFGENNELDTSISRSGTLKMIEDYTPRPVPLATVAF
jgi:hypothetical protein